LEGLATGEQERVNQAILAIAARHERNGAIENPAQVLIGSAVKP